MSASVLRDTLPDSSDSHSSVTVRRKPPPAVPLARRPSTASAKIPLTHTQYQPAQANQSFHKPSFSERYPDPDPLDPFAPLWVLRNRTSSALHREGPPALGHLLQQRDTDEFGVRQPDRRRSISTFHTLTVACNQNSADGSHSAYASDHGYGDAAVRVQRTYSIDNSGNKAPSNLGGNGNGNLSFTSGVRRQSMRPTPLSQVTVLATPSVSRGSVSPAVPVTPISAYALQRPLTAGDDSSGTESDVTRVGYLGLSDVDATPRAVAQASYRHSHDHQPPHQEEQRRSRTSSGNKLTRFLKPRKMSQSDSNSHNVRASITGINRFRKGSISPPVFSTVIWSGQGGEFAPIKDHPLQQNAISIITATSDVLSPQPLPRESEDLHAKQGFSPVPAPFHHPTYPQHLPNLDSNPLQHDHAMLPLSRPVPPALASRPSTSYTHTHTDESYSAFSFVHLPTSISSPSLAQLAASHPDIVPGVSAMIASPATMKIKRTSSRPMSKLPSLSHSISSSSPWMSTANDACDQLGSIQLNIGEWDLPSLHSLTKAASLPIVAESGVRITFGTLFAQQKVVVLFIRHFWCHLCQDYMTSVASLTRRLGPEAILGCQGDDHELSEKSGAGAELGKSGPLKLVVISNGSYTMIGKYKQIFGSSAASLDIYTDPSLAVYAALGMGKDPASLSGHSHSHLVHERSKSSQARLDTRVLGSPHGTTCSDASMSGGGSGFREPSKSGGYVKHGLMGGIAMVFMRALKVGMPVWEKGGDLNQLGGEFVLGPGLVCTYAHRMQTTKGHAPFEDVLRAAGISISISPSNRLLSPTKDSREEKRHDDKKPNSLRKSRPSIGNPLNQGMSAKSFVRGRGQTIDIVPASTTQFHSAPAIPTSVSTPLTSKLSQSSDNNGGNIAGITPERKRLHKRGKSSPTTTSKPMAAPASAEPFAQMKGSVKSGQERREDWEIEKISAISTIPVPSNTLTSSPTEMMTPPSETFVRSSPDHTPGPEVETRWVDEGHRSLQKIKERKNARRGLSQVDERQVSMISMSISKSTTSGTMPASTPTRSVSRSSRRHSRSLSPSLSLSPSNSLSPSGSGPIAISRTSTSQSRHLHSRGMERTGSRARHASSSGIHARVGDIERAAQSDTSVVVSRQSERSSRDRRQRGDVVVVGSGDDDDDIVLIGKERMNRVNLSRDHLARLERERELRRAEVEVGVDPVVSGVEDDAETVSDKTLVHQ